MSIASQWYSMESDPLLLISPRRPGNLHRFVMTPVISAGDFVMPVSIIFSSRQTNVVTYRSPDQSFGQFLQNPLNTFRVTPTYKWARGIIGSHVVSYSSLTTGDAKVFGAGFELTPGEWTISAFAGTLRRAIEPDSLLRIPGTYARKFRAARIGYGRDHGFHVYLNAAVMDDDAASIRVPPQPNPAAQGWPGAGFNLRPQQGMAASLDTGIPLGSFILWKTEVAASVFTRDKRSSLVDSLSGSPIGWLTDLRQSSGTDFSAQSSLSLNRPVWGLTLRALYVGDGFVAPGFPYLQTDRFDVTLDPRFRLFDSKIIVQGSIGYRRNNLSETKSRTTSQLLASVDMNVQISSTAGFSLRYANFGMRTGFMLDTLRLEVVSKSLSFSPYLHLSAPAGTHRVQTSFSLDDYEDTNILTGQQRDQQTFSLLLHYSYSLSGTPLSLETSVRHLKNNNPELGLQNFMLQGGGTYRFFQRKMQASLRVGYSSSRTGNFTPDNALVFRPGFRYQVTSRLTASLGGSIRLYRYGSSRPDASFTENLFRTTVGYRF